MGTAALRCFAVIAAFVFTTATAGAVGALIPSADGQTVHDTALRVTWLANANLAASEKFNVSGINPSGSMSYATAVNWVRAMNAAGYLGHNNWQLPTTPHNDRGCAARGRQGESFGFGCSGSALGSLYYNALQLHDPNAAAAVPDNTAGGFHNVQPYLYWSASAALDPKQGFVSFSFASGFQGANVAKNYLYVLPMIPGKLPGTPGTVYDPADDVTWLADGNLAAKETFGVTGINADGSMTHATAVLWVGAMDQADNGRGYLGRNHWQLPETVTSDQTCSVGRRSGFGCKGSPFGALFYGLMGLRPGDSFAPPLDAKVGPFHGVQPYLYWACEAESARAPCAGGPAPNFEWNFSFGNGFQGTNLDSNALFVMVYYPDES
jgi:hypothetical protein